MLNTNRASHNNTLAISYRPDWIKFVKIPLMGKILSLGHSYIQDPAVPLAFIKSLQFK